MLHSYRSYKIPPIVNTPYSILDELIASFPSDMAPLSTVDVFLPFSLPAQMVFYQNNQLEPRYGVQDSGNKAIIRSNRQKLRAWLATNIPIRFNKTATTLEDGQDGITVHFKDGTSAKGDIVIGADGVSSAVRQYLVKPDPVRVLPIATIVGEGVLSGRDFERQLELGYSGYVASDASSKGDGRGQMFVGVNSVSADGKSGNYYWSMSYFDPSASNLPHWTSSASKERKYEFALEKTSHLLPEFREIIEKTGPEGISDNPLCFRELEIESLPVGKVTLLGDAAHCMTPYKYLYLMCWLSYSPKPCSPWRRWCPGHAGRPQAVSNPHQDCQRRC